MPNVCLSVRTATYLVAFALVTAASTAAAATMPVIAFDAASVVACRDVTPEGFADEYPGEKLVEAEFVISARLSQGSLRHVSEVYFEIHSPEQRLRVLDYWPMTRHECDIDGPIEVTETSEDSRSAGAAIAGSVTTPEAPVKGIVTPSANLGKSKRETRSETYRRIAPKRTVLVSGTIDQGHGIFIKRLPSNRNSLEGSEPVICRFIVPESWQGDWVEVICRARGTRKHTFGDKKGTVGAENITVGLFLTGNREAREAATQMATTQTQAEAWHRKMRAKSELSHAADRIAMSLDSLVCGMRLGRCNKHKRNKTRVTPSKSFAIARESLGDLAGSGGNGAAE